MTTVAATLVTEARRRRPAARDSPAPARPDPRWRLSAAGLGLVCAFMAAFLGDRTRHEWFEVDDWEFLTTRVGPHPLRELMVPHNEHPSMIPILVWRFLFDVFGIVHYWPYMVVLIALHLLVTVEVWWVARRCGAGPGACLVAASVMASLGSGGDNMVWAFQIGMVGSLAASWAGTLLIDGPPGDPFPGAPSGRRLAAVWVVLVAGLCCSAVSVPLLVLPLLVGGVRRGWRVGLRAVSIPVLFFLWWYAVWGRHGTTASSGFQPFQLARFTIDGLATTVDGVTGVTGTAAVVGLLVLVALRKGWLGTRSTVMETAGVVGAIGLFGFISTGRSSLGLAEAETSRYAYLVAALALPAVATALQRFLDRAPARSGRSRDHRRLMVTWVAVAVVTVGLFDRGLGMLENRIALRVGLEDQIRAGAAAADALAATGAPLLATVSVNHYSAYLDGAAVIRLHRLHALDGLHRPGEATLAGVRLTFQTSLAARETFADYSAGRTPPPAAPIRVVLPDQPSPAALTVTPRPFPAVPTVLDGHRAAAPPDLSPQLGCATVEPDPTGQVVVALPLGPRHPVAEYLLTRTPTLVTYGWAPDDQLLVSRSALLEPVSVYQLTSLTRTGTLRVSSPGPLVLCRVA